MVRRELGPSAAVLHTREINNSGLFRWIPGMRKFEVVASNEVNVPSRWPSREALSPPPPAPAAVAHIPVPVAEMKLPSEPTSDKQAFRDELRGQLQHLQNVVEELCRRTNNSASTTLPDRLFRLYTDLIDAELDEALARELVERVRTLVPDHELTDERTLRSRLTTLIENEIHCSGPLKLTPGQCRLVALVGPTGVGKTTTIAKLAAHYRLREKKRVGLITVDTYRIAAVEQLRTYADIIDLPMRVVTTPREIRQATADLANLDLVLLDTAGRSLKDEVQIQELKSFLTEAGVQDVHLVLSAVTGTRTLMRTAESFADVGTTALILSKLDETTNLGNLLPLLRECQLPLSYVTNGQNVPDDIAVARASELAQHVVRPQTL